jgi:predicted subunit of tRNA(5-methylaminomethyl-2-thiouridylate) methyltransferase
VADWSRVETYLRENGLSMSNPEDLPASAINYLHKKAIEYAEQDSRFVLLYNRFYRRSLGDIAKEYI